jgi:hypothetical protein
MRTFTTVASGVRVLFLGETPGAFSVLEDFLHKRGAQCCFAQSPAQGLTQFGTEVFDLILDMTPFQADRSALRALGDAHCNIFSFCQLEVGSLWLPVVQYGKECFGGAALRPKQFAIALEQSIAECTYKVKAAFG